MIVVFTTACGWFTCVALCVGCCFVAWFVLVFCWL